MSYSNISASVTGEVKATIKTNIDASKASLPFLVNLTPQERKKIRKIGPIRFGYVNDVNRAANTFSGVLPISFKLDEYNSDVQLLEDVKDILSWITQFYDALESTVIAIGAEVMKQSDEVYGYLKVAAKKSQDQNLNIALNKISGQLKQGRKTESTVKPE